MTDLEIGTRIAKAAGWVHETNTPFERHASMVNSPFGAWWHPDVAGCSCGHPDYLKSIDAIREAVLYQNENFQYRFEQGIFWKNVHSGISFAKMTARDWCEIFLNCIES